MTEIAEMLETVPESMNAGELLDDKRFLLLAAMVEACETHGSESEESKVASRAFVDGVQALIGELYDKANESVQDGEWSSQTECFRIRATELMKMTGMKEMTFYHANGSGSVVLTDKGELRGSKNSGVH
jgi:hypothetical protein